MPVRQVQVPSAEQRPPWTRPPCTQEREQVDQQDMASGLGDGFAVGAAIVQAASPINEEMKQENCILRNSSNNCG
jgi:hypothetical protein